MFSHPRAALSRCWILLLGCALLASCPGPLPEPPQRLANTERDAAVSVGVEPDASLTGAPAVLRLRIRVPEGAAESPEQVRLFAGTLSSYHLGRIREHALPATLLEREVSATTWLEVSTREIVVAPARPLLPGQTYSVASPALGLIAAFSIGEDGQTPFMMRIWPPKDGGRGIERAIFCGDAGAPSESASVRLEPLAVPAEIGPSYRDESPIPGCVQLASLEQPADGALLVPPLRAGDFALDPAPFVIGPEPRLVPRACQPEESRLGPGCALVQDDRLVLRGFEAPTFWILEAPSLFFATPVQAEQRVVVRNLIPESSLEVSVTVLDRAGRSTSERTVMTTRSVEPHVVISEVLADAIGPEPAQEWIELTNDGRAPVDLDRWTLEDVGGTVLLPPHRLEPGAFVLLVSQGYSEQATWDVAPRSGTAVLRLLELGKNGLANSGEPLLLRSPEGTVVSRFPATPKPKPGVSVARAAPWALDDDAASFRLHGPPGASPGAANVTLPE
jgi:hypothetical protein